MIYLFLVECFMLKQKYQRVKIN